MSSLALPELGITLRPLVKEEAQGSMHVVSSTDPLSMRKMFPLKTKEYTFISRDHLVSYIALWMNDDREQARKIAKAKKKPAGQASFPIPDEVDWRTWSVEIGYLILTHTSTEGVREMVSAITAPNIGSAGKHDVWELGQDKATAGRTVPPHAWGMNAWGVALSLYRQELLSNPEEEVVEESVDGLDVFLEKGGVSRRLSEMKIGNKSIWENQDAVDNFLISFRRAKRLGQLDRLEEWVFSSKRDFFDAWDFISTLPLMDRIKEVVERNDKTIQSYLEALKSSKEKCRSCGSPVRIGEDQDRSPDEPYTIYSFCYNTKTCATEVEDARGLRVIAPLRRRYHANYSQMLKTQQ